MSKVYAKDHLNYWLTVGKSISKRGKFSWFSSRSITEKLVLILNLNFYRTEINHLLYSQIMKNRKLSIQTVLKWRIWWTVHTKKKYFKLCQENNLNIRQNFLCSKFLRGIQESENKISGQMFWSFLNFYFSQKVGNFEIPIKNECLIKKLNNNGLF